MLIEEKRRVVNLLWKDPAKIKNKQRVNYLKLERCKEIVEIKVRNKLVKAQATTTLSEANEQLN